MSYQFADIFKPEKKENDDLQKSVDKVISQAKLCLTSKEFEKYRKAYEAAEAKMVANLISFTNGFMSLDSGDMSFYGAKVARMITKLSDLKALLDGVESDVRKGNQIGLEDIND